MLNARLAEAESQTHDVIRELLGVKLEISNFTVRSDLWTSYVEKPQQSFTC